MLPQTTRPPVAATPGASLAALVAVMMAGTPPALSDARQLAIASKLPFHISESITPSDLADFNPDLSVRGGMADMEQQRAAPPASAPPASAPPVTVPPSSGTPLQNLAAIKTLMAQEPYGSKEHSALRDLHAQQERELQAQLKQGGLSHGSLVVREGLQRLAVASMSGHPTSIFDLADAETAAKALSHHESQGNQAPSPALPASGVVTDSDPTLAAAMPEDDTAAADADDDDDGLEHPSDNAPITAPPKDYRFSPWEELKTHANLLYSEQAIEVRGKTMATIRLKVPARLHGYAGPIEVSPCAVRHRLDHGLDIV